MSAIIPQPRFAIEIRPGTSDDIPFMDELQKLHGKQVGWMPTKQFEGKFKAGHVLVAWASRPCSSDGEGSMGETPMPLGYCIAHDQYFKRDDVGIIYQMNVAPGHQRGLIGASLLKAQFERSAWGCRLYCCWCAQDIAANRFWEAMGFVPLAFRAGSEKKSRVHIFWQKRIRAGDTTTPWWFPAQTSGGSIREDRIVLPIPPGTHWSDAKPLILPGDPQHAALEGPSVPRTKKAKAEPPRAPATPGPLSGALFFAPPAPPKEQKPPREKKPKAKNDPRLVAKARELRDRYLEHLAANPSAALLPTCGKYDVSRALPSAIRNPQSAITSSAVACLPAAA
jgi:hypothetical protein